MSQALSTIGDVEATYEAGIVQAHQAELVALKNLTDQRVATATSILHDVGLA